MHCASNNMIRHTFKILLIGVALAFGTAFNPASASSNTVVSFGVPPWPGEYVKAAVATQILESLGYETKQYEGSGPFLMKSVGLGELDVYMAVWRPVNNSVIKPLLESGDVVLLNTNVANAKYNIVVPQYVWDAGVHSIADLHKYGKKFDYTIYGIEVGNVGNRIMIKAIKNNTYKLAGWHVMPSSTSGMLAQAAKSISEHEWIAFLGWKPHWMNIKFDLKYLKDPLNVWGPNGGQNAIQTIANKTFVKNHPNIVRFLEQMDVGSETQSQWIYSYAYKGNPADKVARQWIQSHPETIAQWLKGVTTVDGGTAAFEAVKAKIGFDHANDTTK